jgi:hypothetical protein
VEIRTSIEDPKTQLTSEAEREIEPDQQDFMNIQASREEMQEEYYDEEEDQVYYEENPYEDYNQNVPKILFNGFVGEPI